MTENLRKRGLRPVLSGVLLRSQTDGRLCALARTGHEQAFCVIYERYRRELGSHACRIVRADRGEDVVQQAMLVAWTALLAGAKITNLRAWLHRVVHNAALDTVTKRGYDNGEIPDSSIALALTEELAAERLDAGAALAAIAALPENQRRALTLTAIEGRSGHDAALAMGINQSAMRQLVYRARSSVRAAVTAITPLPLITSLVAGGGVSATPAAVGLGAAGGGAATVAKVVAVIGVTAATLGATHTLQGHHHETHNRNAPTGPAATTTAERGHAAGSQQSLETNSGRLLALGGSLVNQQPKPGTNNADGHLAGGQHPTGGQNGSSQQGPGGNADRQSGSQIVAGSASDHQSGTQQQSTGRNETVTAQSGTHNGSLPEQSSQGTAGTSSERSGANRSTAGPNAQNGNGN